MAKDKRFEVIYSESGGFSGPIVKILRDNVTGVQYLLTHYGEGSGLTPLLNRDGTPVVGTVVR